MGRTRVPERRPPRARAAVLSLRRWTAGGFEPVPPAAAPRTLTDTDRLRGDRYTRLL
ncbi:hypothetical protein [Streptomyces sp. NPDC049915]|uniref:hypothetical protein n=1 Tax=Streptomyces sp. NPDC049915 TaxID=3155510 RepID=UPI003428A334